MFINSLFLSKLLNLKTEKQSSAQDENGFSHLFSEIIKIKNAAEETSFVPENIGGTLLDHKTIFISNSSPLENKSISKSTSAAGIIEELYKLFNSDNNLPKSDSSNLISSLNKITTDKNQFLNSIQMLIKNILNDTNNQSDEVEVRYVSKNLIETKKVNKENLFQFTEYLSKLIEGNQSFSFVIGANARQILFDVENLSPDIEENTNLQVVQSTVKSKIESDLEFESEIESTTENTELKTDAIQNISDKDVDENLLLVKNDSKENSKQLSDSISNNQRLNLVGNQKLKPEVIYSFNEKSSLNTKLKPENDNLNSVISNEREIFASSFTKSKSSENEIKIEIDGEFISHNSDQTLKTEKPEFKFDGIGEVKIVIKEKSSFSFPSNENRIVPENSTKESFIQKNQQKKLNPVSEPQNLRAEKSEPAVKTIPRNYPEHIEQNSPKIIHTQSNEPRIGRAGLPLIADYQDWDLVFEKSTVEVNNNFKKEITFENKTSVEEKADQFQIPKTPELKQQKEAKINSEISLKVEPEKAAEKRAANSSEDIKEFNEVSEPKEKVLHLKFSEEKKIVAVTDTAKERVILSAEEVKAKSFIESNTPISEKKSVSIDPNKFVSEKLSAGNRFNVVNEVNSQSTETNYRESFKDQNQNNSETRQTAINTDQVNKEKNIPNEKSFESEYVISNKQYIQPEIKSHLLNSKTIIEHFIKNPIESRTLEKFLLVLDKQEIIQKSEIVSYSKQSHSVEIKLSPEELGSIKILLDTNDNNVNAKIEVGNEHTKAIVVNNLPQLKESLTQQGINLNNVNVTVSSEEQRNPEQTKQKSKKKSQNDNSKVEITEEKKTVRNLGYNTYEYLA